MSECAIVEISYRGGGDGSSLVGKLPGILASLSLASSLAAETRLAVALALLEWQVSCRAPSALSAHQTRRGTCQRP